MIDAIQAVDTVSETTSSPERRSPLRTVLAVAVTAAAAGVLALCITGGAESVADQSPTAVTTATP